MNNMSQGLTHPRKQAEKIGVQSPPPPNSENSEESTLDLGAVWTTIKRSKWIILGTCVLVTALTAGITMMMPKVYEASTVVSIERESPVSPQMVSMNDQRDLGSEIGILQNSGELARRVISTVQNVADTTQGAQFTLLAPVSEEEPFTQQAGISRLREMTSFTTDQQQGLIHIRVSSQHPKEAAVIANAYAKQYRLYSQEMAREGVTAARKFLEEQLEKRKDSIRSVENEWEQFARSNSLVTEGTDGQNVAQQYVEIQSRRDALEFQLEQEKRTLSVLEEKLQKAKPNLRSSVLKEQEVQSLRTQIQALEDQIAKLKASAEQYYINDSTLRGNESRVPELAEIKRRIEGFESRKVELTEQLVEAAEEAGGTGGSTGGGTGGGTADGTGTSIGQVGTLKQRIQEQKTLVEQLKAQIQSLKERESEYQSRLSDIPQQSIRREQLNRRLSQSEEFYNEIAKELQRTVVTEESELGYVKVMQSAAVPTLPVSPNVKRNIILGLLLGLGMGMGLGFLRQSMDWQIYEPNDIQSKGYSLVGVIPKMDQEIKKAFNGDDLIDVEGRNVSTRLFPLLNPWSPITENYRLVRANLQFSAAKGQREGEQSSQTIMVTSPEPGDGKTTTAVNLALTIALSGRKVLIIDADMRRPNMHKMLGIERGPGLAQVLAGNAGVETILKDEIIDGLHVLPAGVPDIPTTELLDSERMREFLASAEGLYDVVIIDTPPVLAATDPVVVAPYCSAVLVVAAANKTDFRALSQVRSTLDAVGVDIGGIIFNRYDSTQAGSYEYGYGYNYNYDYVPTE